MGKANSKLTPEALNELSKLTYFDKKELQQWYFSCLTILRYKGFIRDCPTGVLRKQDVRGIYQQFFPFGDSAPFADYVFDAFDINGTGCIEFKEFILALSITTRGKLEERLRWAFSFYDIDKDGMISKTEMLKTIEAIYKMIGNMVKLPEDEDTPSKRVEKIFQIMDKVCICL